jgi:ribonuclease P protein component
MGDLRFSKRMRLLRPSDFERVFAAKRSVSDASIVLYGAPNELDHPRLGLVVSRRVGGATQRNRWKRLLREAFRQVRAELPPLDLVCVVRSTAPPTLASLRATFLRLANRIQEKLAPAARPGDGKVS